MTIEILDSVRRKHFFEPWIMKKEKKHQILSDPVVKSIIIDAITSGSNKHRLKDSLDPLFKIAGDSAGKFIHSLRKKINEWNKIDSREIQKITNRKSNFHQNHVHNEQRKPNKPQYFGEHVHFIHNNPQLPSTSVNPSSIVPEVTIEMVEPKQNVPSYFLSTEEISLRSKDQKMEKLRLNEKGEQIDEKGNVIHVERVNMSETYKTNPNYDKKIPTVIKPRSLEFHFLKPGEITREIEEKRKEVKIDLSVAAGLPIFDVIAMRRNYEIPEIDWWDEPFIDKETWEPILDNVDSSYQNTAPVPMPKLKEKEIPTMLTPEEMKREKHLRKLEKANEERLLIRLNLKEPEPPRVKTKTLINFNSGEAFLKPTEVETRARNAYEARQKAHLERNEMAKLSPEQKQQKAHDKRLADSNGNTIDLVYCMKNIYHPLQFSKILAMANKWMITGGLFIVKHPEMYFVVAECGEKGARKFSALIENRIDWKMKYEGVDENISNNNDCKLVFQSSVLPHQRHFRNFKKYVFDVSTQCSSFFQKYKAGHLFDPTTRIDWINNQ